jgi:hypothetical protein
MPLSAFADSFFTLSGAILVALWRAVVSIWSWIGGMAASFSIAALGVCRYAPVILRRHWFWTFCSGSSKLFASVPPSSRIPHTWAPYSIAGRTVAVYRRRKWRIDGPHVEPQYILIIYSFKVGSFLFTKNIKMLKTGAKQAGPKDGEIVHGIFFI